MPQVHVHRSNRMERLVEVLAELVARPRPVFEPVTVVVQSAGMERWVSLELARRLGVFAGAEFPFPRALIERVLSAVVGGAEASAAFSPESLAWSIAGLLPELIRRPSFAPIARYLDSDPHGLKRLELGRRAAAVFDQYAVYRPDQVLAWDKGQGQGWQPELWRALVDRHGSVHLAARAACFLDRWRDLSKAPEQLPREVLVFGVSSLPPIYMELLAALGERLQVHLFQLSPSREYWGEIRSRRELWREMLRPGTFGDLGTGGIEQPAAGNPLLASLGRVGREFQGVLEAACDYLEDGRDLYCDPGQASALSVLQSDMLLLRERGRDAAPLKLSRDDRSIAVHVCHAPTREVEVLRDQLLGLFDADVTLEPQDVLVMMPDVDLYAPLIDAVFAAAPGERGFIPYRIADRKRRSGNAIDEAFARLLAVLGGRMKASEVLDLMQLGPLRARFDIDHEELARLSHWIHDAGIRWGVDAADRARHEQPELEQNTWRFGLKRLFLGYAMPGHERSLFCGVLPYDEVEGRPAEALGKLGELTERLFVWREHLAVRRNVPAWCETLTELCDDLLGGDGDDAGQLIPLRKLLSALGAEAARAGFDEPVELDLIRSQIEARLDEERTTHEFLSGGVTFCAILPMRSIPFRVVALLGLGDEDFPRRRRAPGFDLIAAHPRPADRSLGDEDRHLFLEAILSARQRLIISYVGRSIQDNSDRPPSAVVGELLDAIDESFVVHDGRSDEAPRSNGAPPEQLTLTFESPPEIGGRRSRVDPATPAHRALVVEHPLQPFSARYFGADDDPRLFSYALAEARGAQALSESLQERPRFQRLPLEPEPTAPGEVDLDELTRFFEHPVRAFLQKRLGLYLAGQPELVEDREPIELGPLERYRIGAFLLERALAGEASDDSVDAVRAAGLLPLGALGRGFYAEISRSAAELARAATQWREGGRLLPRPVSVELSGGRISGQLTELWPRAQLRCQYSRVSAKHELGMWIRHLTLACGARAGDPETTVIVGRPREGPGSFGQLVFRRIESDRARELLVDLVELYRLGQQIPLCLFPRSSRKYAEQLASASGSPHAAERAVKAARKVFEADPTSGAHSERDDRYIERAFGDADPLDPDYRVLGEKGPGFAGLSVRVFGPLLDQIDRESG